MATYDARPSGFTQLTTTADWESFISSSGIADGIDGANSFVPTLDVPGRNAVISAGQGLIKGQLWRCDAPVNTAIPAASAQNRIDRLVLRLNRGAVSSPLVVAPTIITGTPSGSPVIPPIVQTPTGIYDIPVSNWLATSAGGLSGLVDQRQFSGRSVVMMTSTFHPSPPNPCLGYETDTGQAFAWNGTTWRGIGDVYTTKVNATPRTVTALALDPDLQTQVAANAVYAFKAAIPYQNSTGASAFAWNFALPAGASGFYGGFWAQPGPVYQSWWVNFTANQSAAASDNIYHVLNLAGTLTTGATPGTFGLQWACATASAGTLNVGGGSWLALGRIS